MRSVLIEFYPNCRQVAKGALRRAPEMIGLKSSLTRVYSCVYAIITTGARMFAFVLMPFDPKFDDIYKLGIKETADKLGITAERIDEQIFYKENILERIYNQILACDFVIADMTGRNANVFYETGYAHAKGKTCLLLTSNADDIPFDLKHHRHIVYGSSIQNLRNSLEREPPFITTEVLNRQSVIVVELGRSDSILEKTKWSATAKVELYFDLNNRTNGASPEIEAMYFYTGPDWKFSQDGQHCASTASDTAAFQMRHFVRPPVRRLQAASWAQVKLVGEKVVGYAFERGSTLKDSYRLTGKASMKVVTAEGAYEYPLSLDIEVTEFPF